jgi:guanylate kinase
VLAPSYTVLERRLINRSSDRPENIEVRLNAAKREVDRYTDYDYLVVNDDVDRSTELLRSIVLAERARPSLMEAQIRPIVDSFKMTP